MSRPGLLARALAFLRRSEVVGGDAHGNVYFTKREKLPGGEEIIRRMVRTPTGTNPYAYDATRIAPEWTSWLRGTRPDPPSPEEAAAAAAARERARALGVAAAAARAARAAADAPPVRLTRQLGEGGGGEGAAAGAAAAARAGGVGGGAGSRNE